MEHSLLLCSADYLFYLNPANQTKMKSSAELIQDVFKDWKKVTFKFGPRIKNKQFGAMKPYKKAQ